MPFYLELPPNCRGWSAKIRDKERLEPPHVTIIAPDGRTWRWCLRDQAFLDREPPAREVPKDLLAAIEAQYEAARAAWDGIFPNNPVANAKD